MSAILRATEKPRDSVLLPGGGVRRNPLTESLGASTDSLRDIVREAHQEMAVAAAVDAIGAMTPAPSATPSSLPVLAEIDRENARREGFDHGYAEGLAQAKAAVAQEWQAKLEDLDLLVEAFQREREEMIPKLEDDLVAIAFEGITMILGEPAMASRVVREAVRKAAAGVASDSPITIRLSPDQYAQLSGADAGEFLARRKGAIDWVEDARVELGGCIVETSRGTLDARLETQVDRLRKALLAARAQS